MLEIRNLTKIYKTKGGADTRALDNVSIKFEETGLVFLLGKSGSGKSTLLNLAGGLDEPTSGEVIVMGKSSRHFSGSDFDSYRNTYVGFVFQEYNVLNEFNVEENVSLALELQGKTREKEKVRKILEEVELEAFAKRKPNTLSGGQKQRIAIARALVKDPQIIMADEPTGALDSATGKQVFDTLKKLSETRLVLVVSHDREFAELYGDRIVELKDGRIISDVIKVREKAAPISDNMLKIGEDTLTVKAGAPLDDAAFSEIRAFLENSNSEVVISRGEREVANFKRVNRIDDNGARERFDNTDESKLDIKPYDGSSKFIRSRLPARKAMKIGASGLKLKPLRLSMTVFLSAVAFIMFGLFSTMMLYDPIEVLIKTFIQSDYEYLMIDKNYEVRRVDYFSSDDPYSYTVTYKTRLTPAEAEMLGGSNGFGAYSVSSYINNLETGTGEYYYRPVISSVAVLPENHPLRDESNFIAGGYPTKADEICVSSYLLECAENLSFYSKDDGTDSSPLRISSAQELISQKFSTDYGTFTISGVFDSGAIPLKYEALKEPRAENNWTLRSEFSSYISESLHGLIFVNESFVEENLSGNGGNNSYIDYFDYGNYYYFASEHYEDFYLFGSSEIKAYEPNPTDPQLPIYRLDGKTSALADNELILSIEAINQYFRDQLNRELGKLDEEYPVFEDFENEDNYAAALDDYIARYNEIESKMNKFSTACESLLTNYVYNYETGDGHALTEKAKQEMLATVFELVTEPFTITLRTDGYDKYDSLSVVGDFNVVGFYIGDGGGAWYDGIYCSQSFYDNAGVYGRIVSETKYVEEDDATYNYIFVPFEHNYLSLSTIFARLFETDPDTDIVYSLNNGLYSEVVGASMVIQILSTVFLVTGIVLALFASLLLFNFISLSITNKKKEIGILRAVGARGTDVFKIFFSESGIIVCICMLLAVIGTDIITMLINNIVRMEIGFQATLFVFGPIPILIMLAIAIIVAVVSTFLPVYLAARKKPVESIRAL